MQLVVISPPYPVDNEIETLIELFHNGLEIFHLRKPDFSRKQAADYVAGIPGKFHKRLVLHGHHRLIETSSFKGLHFTEAQRRAEFGRITEIRNARPKLSLSSSFHRLGDITAQGNIFDYIFLSPVFDSISKKNYRAAFDLPDLESFLRSWPNKVFALGGVNAKQIPDVGKHGFHGAAVLGAVWEAENPINAFLKIKQAAEAA